MNNAQKMANLLAAIANCDKSGNWEWHEKHSDALLRIVRDELPSGSGFDSGVALADVSTPENLVFTTFFHHMDEHGYYCGWSEHRVSVRASLVHGIDVRVSGRNVRDIKEYIGDVFHAALTAEFSA